MARSFLALSLAALLAMLLAGGARAGEPDSGAAEERLAERYTPVVFVREQSGECDRRGGAFTPASVDILVDQPGITLRDSGGIVSERVTVADLFEGDGDLFIDLPGDPRNPGCGYERDFRRIAGGARGVAYAHFARQEGHEGFALQYWFFYYFNDWNNKHEGDWEMIQLLFDVETAQQALATEPYAVGYSQHGGGESADWDDDKIRKEGDRPHVYVAAGAHASFYRDRTYLGRAEEGKGFGCDDTSPPVREVPVEARLIPQTISGPDDPFAWTTYEGRWGQRLRSEFNGPTGPNMKRAWDAPFDWQDDLRTVSVEVPIKRTIGPNASQFFCDSVAFLSNNVLTRLITSPWMVLGAGMLVIGAMVTTVARTRFTPIASQPLRQRRRFGQMLTCAARISAERPFLMLALGLVFIPAGVVTSTIQGMLVRAPGVSGFVDILRRSPWTEAAFLLGIGALGVIIAFLVTMAGVAAAIREADEGRTPTIRGSYHTLWEHLRVLLLARVRAAAIITLLGVTIVGLPWAILRVVRWVFVEWAVVLEDKDEHEALDASARVVNGQVLRTLGIVVLLVLIGVGLGPVTGVVLMFATDLPLEVINGISSLIYLSMVPYVGVAMTLLYFDLQLANETEAAPAAPSPDIGPAPQPA